MKKFFAIAVAAMVSAATFAQTEAGRFFIAPKAGVNVADLSGINENYTAKVGLAAGVQVGYQVSDKFAVTADVLYSQQGSERSTTWEHAGNKVSAESKMKLEYLNIPILANYYITRGLAIKAGIQPGINLSAKSTYESSVTASSTHDFKDDTNGFDISIPVGVSYEYKNFILDARYVIGVTDVFDTGKTLPSVEGEDPVSIKSVKNGVFQLTLGYKLPL